MSAKRILVVEDEENIRETLRYNLVKEGYRVDEARTGPEALAEARRVRPDLILLDLMLPELSGLEVCRILRQEMSTPILVLTAKGAEVDKVVGLSIGADDYVTKPFSLPELEARVRALIRRSQVVKSPKLRFGRLTVDTVARRASIGPEILDLTPREWAVLEYLLMRVGQVVSKEHMLQAMCSWDDSLTHNAIEVYISRLRSKLHDAGIRIRTVRGFGYMVEDPDAV
jgi:two-component system, OmpR family, response regulator